MYFSAAFPVEYSNGIMDLKVGYPTEGFGQISVKFYWHLTFFLFSFSFCLFSSSFFHLFSSLFFLIFLFSSFFSFLSFFIFFPFFLFPFFFFSFFPPLLLLLKKNISVEDRYQSLQKPTTEQFWQTGWATLVSGSFWVPADARIDGNEKKTHLWYFTQLSKMSCLRQIDFFSGLAFSKYGYKM